MNLVKISLWILLLLSSVASFPRSLAGYDLTSFNVEPFCQAGGTRYQTNGAIVCLLPIPKSFHKTITEQRLGSGTTVYSFEQVSKEAGPNREYALSYIKRLIGAYVMEKESDPSLEQIFLITVMGFENFKSLSFDPNKVQDQIVLLKLALFRELVAKNQLPPINVPPPLPSAQSLSRNYRPGPSEHR